MYICTELIITKESLVRYLIKIPTTTYLSNKYLYLRSSYSTYVMQIAVIFLLSYCCHFYLFDRGGSIGFVLWSANKYT